MVSQAPFLQVSHSTYTVAIQILNQEPLYFRQSCVARSRAVASVNLVHCPRINLNPSSPTAPCLSIPSVPSPSCDVNVIVAVPRDGHDNARGQSSAQFVSSWELNAAPVSPAEEVTCVFWNAGKDFKYVVRTGSPGYK